jgi:trehalose-6-phosphate synthase
MTNQRAGKNEMPMMVKASHDLEQVLISSGLLDDAPFWWIGLMYRKGLKNEPAPEIRGINKKYGELPVAFEIDVRLLYRQDDETIYRVYCASALWALIHVGRKYELPTAVLESRLAELGEWPPQVIHANPTEN